jgi:hypothetical protein
MNQIPFTILIESRTAHGTPKVLYERDIKVDQMKTSKVMQICSREFNKALKLYAGSRETIVSGGYHGQMTHGPFTMYSGSLSGVGGRIMARRGSYDQ